MKITEDVYYDYKGMKRICDALCKEYDFLSSRIIGKTFCGRDIVLLKIGKAKESVLYCASMHGNESITTTLLLKLIEDICKSLKEQRPLSGIDIKRMLRNRSFCFVPMVNPDGCEIAQKGEMAKIYNINKIKCLCGGEFQKWKANARGVDINRNFDADWEKTSAISIKHGFNSPTYMKFGGYFPNSEAETLALVNLCKELKPNHLISLHTQGEVIFYGWKNSQRDEARLANILAMLSGYSVEIPEELSLGGGLKDWFVKTYNKPGYTIECGKGENPLPEMEIAPIYKRIFEMLAVSLII